MANHVEREECAQLCDYCCESDSEKFTPYGRQYGALGEPIPFLAGPLLRMLLLPLLIVRLQLFLEVSQDFFIVRGFTIHRFYHLWVHATLVQIDTFNEGVRIPVHKYATAACFALRCLKVVAFNTLWVNLFYY